MSGDLCLLHSEDATSTNPNNVVGRDVATGGVSISGVWVVLYGKEYPRTTQCKYVVTRRCKYTAETVIFAGGRLLIADFCTGES